MDLSDIGDWVWDNRDDILTGVGTVLEIWDDYERKEISETAAKFTRQRQILDITAFIAEQSRLREINLARKTWMDESQRAVIEGVRDYALAESDYWSTRSAAELSMGRGRAADDALERKLRFDVQEGELAVQGAKIAAARLSLGHERAGNEFRQAAVLARQDAIADKRNLLNVETAERGQILMARQASVRAGLASVQARREQVIGVHAAQREGRLEEAQLAGGAVAAGMGARGMGAGSFAGTAGRQIGREAARDIRQLDLGAAAQLGQLGERQADLMLEGQRIRSEGRIGAARDAVRAAELDAEGMGYRADLEGLRGEQAQLQGREGILAAQEGLLDTERLAIESGRAISERQRIRDETRAQLVAAQSGLRGAAATIDATKATADLADLEIDISQIGAEITTGDTAVAIADWTLSNVPDLPDLDTFFLRGAIGTLLGGGQRSWG